MEVTQLAFVHSERDLLWNKLIHEGTAYEAVCHHFSHGELVPIALPTGY